jgi:processive 1,2-diacylglycerol beta-glucosyltransferase
MKVLVLYASFGSGHKRAAEAVVEAFQDRSIAAESRDLLDFLPRSMARFYSFAYDFMITKGRSAWRLTYDLMNTPKTSYKPATAIGQRWQFTRLKEFLHHFDFTHAVCTHFTPLALLTDWRAMGELHCKLFSIITDHESHRCWKRTGLDHYFVASPEVASELKKAGIPETDITISGIPISRTFSDQPSREIARQTCGLPQNGILALVLCSAITPKKSVQILEEFRTVQEQLRYLVLAGSDPEREKILRSRFGNDDRFIIYGFTSHIAELMKACDLIITKPGGLIVSEAFAARLPQLLLEPIPGQEEANARYAIEHGAALPLIDKKGMYAQNLAEILRNPSKLKEMSDAAAKAARPRAAAEIAETILSRFVV